MKQPNHDKPHSKLDVLRGLCKAGTQSPTNVFMTGQAQESSSREQLKRAAQESSSREQLKGPLAKLNQWRRTAACSCQPGRASKVVCRRQIHIGGKELVKNRYLQCLQPIASFQREKFQSASCCRREKFQSASTYGKLHCVHRQENSSLPGICKNCILQTVVL